MGSPSDARRQVIRFGEFELDEAGFELRQGGARVAVQPRVFDLLRCLIVHRDHVVTKEELVATVWGGARVVNNAIARAVCEARRALGEGADAQSTIATVRGRGYRFVASVEDDVPASSRILAIPGGSDPPLVGRDALLSDLDARIARALGGEGGIALLAGEPGIGKTRLIDEITTRLAPSGARIVVSRCYEGEGAPPFWPWTQVARELTPRADASTTNAATTDLAALFPGARVGSPTGPRARFELFEAVTTLVKRVADEAPLLIAIDDLHCADDASLHLLVNAAGVLRRTRTMILGTLRTTGRRSPQLSIALGALRRMDPSSTVQVDGLRREDIATFVRVSTGEALPAAEIERLAEATGGNPLFLEQLAHLRFKGALPDGVVQAIVRHLEILREPCRAALARASVIGRSFSPTLLAHLCDVSHDELADLLDEAARGGVVVRDGDELRFAHALIRDALYSLLSAVERGTLHARAARAIVLQTSGRPDVPLSTIAHHFLQAAGAGGVSEAIEYATRAAEDALARFGWETAIELYEGALAALDTRPDPGRRRELLMRLGLARSRAGDHMGSRAAFEEAATLARSLGMAVEMASAAFLAALPPESGLPDVARVDLLREALHANADTPSGSTAMCTARVAIATWATESPVRRRELAERAVQIARAAGDREALAYTLKALHGLCWQEFPADAARASVATELAALASTGSASSDTRVMAIEAHLADAVMAGDALRTRAELARFERLATELRRPYLKWCDCLNRTMHALAEGRFGDAEVSYAAAATLTAREANEVRDIQGGVQMFMLRREQGRLGELEAVLRQLVAAFPAISWPCGLAYMALYYGDPEEARALLLARFGPDAPPQPESSHAITLNLFAEVAVRLREERAAKVIYDALSTCAGLEIVVGPSMAVDGCSSRMLGALAAMLGRWDEAEVHFARAIEVDENFGARPFVAYAHAAYAEALVRRGRRGDATRVDQHAAKAAVIAHELGMFKLLERLAPFGAKQRSAE